MRLLLIFLAITIGVIQSENVKKVYNMATDSEFILTGRELDGFMMTGQLIQAEKVEVHITPSWNVSEHFLSVDNTEFSEAKIWYTGPVGEDISINCSTSPETSHFTLKSRNIQVHVYCAGYFNSFLGNRIRTMCDASPVIRITTSVSAHLVVGILGIALGAVLVSYWTKWTQNRKNNKEEEADNSSKYSRMEDTE